MLANRPANTIRIGPQAENRKRGIAASACRQPSIRREHLFGKESDMRFISFVRDYVVGIGIRGAGHACRSRLNTLTCDRPR